MSVNMRKMSKFLFSLVLLIGLTTACGKKEGGELTGVLDRPSFQWNQSLWHAIHSFWNLAYWTC